MIDAVCKYCALLRSDLRRAIHKANNDVMRHGVADTGWLNELKRQVAACGDCGGTGRVPSNPSRNLFGRRDVVSPKPPKAKRQKRTGTFDQAQVAAALAEKEAEALTPKQLATRVVSSTTRGTTLSPTGRCHICDRPVSGERRFCGTCAAARDGGRAAS